MKIKDKRELLYPIFEQKVKDLIAKGKTRLSIYDNDTAAYETGYAMYLMEHYRWFNGRLDCFVVFLNQPTQTVKTPFDNLTQSINNQ